MKNILIITFLVFTSLTVRGQSWNPYVGQGLIEPAPILPLEFNGEGEISFNIGNTGSSDIEADMTNPEKNLIIIISLHDGIPNMNNPLSALGGSWVGKFEWTYEQESNSFVGVQKFEISGKTQGNLIVGYKVAENASIYGATNGFDVQLIAPAYMSSNHSGDDRVSSYTFTGAYDQGDAPTSYGTAMHEINFVKDDFTGMYKRYLYLGDSVDQEPTPFASVAANGDDNDNIDDEDGVTFPTLIAGSTATISIVATSQGNSGGVLNAWIDWNGDGDFFDVGEKVTDNPIFVFTSDLINMDITVPENAVTKKHTYARFRIGGHSGPTALNAWGEVEDYRVKIKKNPIQVTVTKKDISKFGKKDGSIKLKVNGGTTPYKYLWSNGIAKRDLENLDIGDYSVRITDSNNITVNRTVTILEPSEQWENELVLTSKNKNREVTLNWETPTERNTASFIVERSTDGGAFIQISDNISAAGNSSKPLNYSYKDKNVEGEIVTYRVVLSEISNARKTSNKVINVLEDESSLKVELFPVPVNEVYSIKINQKGSYIVELIDLFGKIVTTSTMDVDDHNNEKTMYRNGIMSGIYILRVTDKSNLKYRNVKVLMSE